MYLSKTDIKSKYPVKHINTSITKFLNSIHNTNETLINPEEPNKIRIFPLPFKDQQSADNVHKQLKDLGNKVRLILQPVFSSPKIGDKIKLKEEKPALINQQCVVYKFKCDRCDANYIGFTTRHFFQ